MVAIDPTGECKDVPPDRLLTGVENQEPKRRLLVPFEISMWSPWLLQSAVYMAERIDAELVLLCTCHPSESRQDSRQEAERLFSALKGLYAQLQDQVMPVRIETVTGPVAQSVLDFAEQNEVDMLLVAGHLAVTGGGEDKMLSA